MGFKTKVVSIVKIKIDGKPSISYRKNATKAGGNKPKLIIGIPGAILHKFKHMESDTFSLMLGDGSDAGKAMILRDKTGVCKAHKFGAGTGALSFKFGFVPSIGMDAVDKEQVELVAETADSITITLPPWFCKAA